MSNIRIELSEKDVRELIYNHLQEKLGSVELNREKVVIEVKSAQNYKSTWEKADFKVVYENYEF